MQNSFKIDLNEVTYIYQAILQQKQMRSASVAVYRRPKTILQSPEKASGIRIFVNKYTSVSQKQAQEHKRQITQKGRSRTARIMQKINKQRKIAISSLNIVSITTQTPSLLSSTPLRKMSSSNIFSIKRSSRLQQNFMLKLPQNSSHVEGIERVMIRASAKDILKHAKVKILSKIRCQKPVTLVLSIDFIYNQFNFWAQQQQQIEEGAVHTLRLLLPLVNMIWVIRSQSSQKKLTAYAQSKGLRLDGIVQIEPNKKQPLTISFYPLQKQLNLPRNHKLLIINSIKSGLQTPISQFQFRNSLPVISHPLTFIHFIRINMNNKTRIQAIKKIVTQSLPSPYNLTNIFEQHRDKKQKMIANKAKIKKQIIVQQQDGKKYMDISQRLQKVKQTLLVYFQKSFGLRTKLDGDSLAYIVGDMIKRNYRIARDFYNYCQQLQLRNQNKANSKLNELICNKMKKIQYNRNVYLWQY